MSRKRKRTLFYKNVPLVERFRMQLSGYDQNGCLIWGGSTRGNGYGRIYAGFPENREVGAHRVAYELATGCKIPAGMMVLHSCDNPSCVNPEHLRLGTHCDNMNDRRVRGKYAHSQDNHSAKLTNSQVIAIRKRWAKGGIPKYKLAEKYGVSPRTIKLIVERELWKYVQ